MLTGLMHRIFNLHPGEGKKILQFALLGAILQAGISIGLSCSDTLFLSQLGPDYLPYIYLLTPVIFAFYIPIYSFLINRIGIDRVFDITMLVLVFGGMMLALLLSSTDPELLPFVIYAAKLYSILWYIALYSLFWNFVDGYFDILDAKRLFSLLSAGSALGAAVGGITVSLLADLINIPDLFMIWSAISLLGLLLGMSCRKSWQRIDIEDVDEQTKSGIKQQTKDLLSTFKNSRFALLLGATLFVTMIVTLVCEYQYSVSFADGRSEAELAKLFGTLFFAVNIINLFINLFVFNRLVQFFGVRNMALVQPVCYAATFIIFLFDNSYYAGVFGFFAYHGMLTSIDYNNTNLLLHALPTESRRQLRTFIEGICEPMANAFAGGFLIFLVAYLSPIQISTIGLSLAVFSFLLVLALRPAYLSSMVSNLKLGWLDFSNPEREILSKLKEDEIASLKIKAASITRDNKCLQAIGILIPRDPEAGIDFLLSFIQEADAVRQRDAGGLLNGILEKRDNSINQKIVLWATKHLDGIHISIVESLARFGLLSAQQGLQFSASSCPRERAISAIVLRNSSDVHLMTKSLNTIESLLHSDPESKLAAIKAIGSLGLDEYAQFLLPYVSSSDPEVSTSALEGLSKIVSRNTTGVVAELLPVFGTLPPSQRHLCLEIFARIGDAASSSELLRRSEDLTPRERRKIEQVIAQIGLKSLPASLSVLRDPDYSYNARSLAARSVVKLSFPQLEAIADDLIETEIRRAYSFRDFQIALNSEAAPEAGIRVLQQHYRDSERLSINFVLELLTLSGRLANFELIAASLRSDSKRERGNAIEAIQAACSRRLRRKLLPLLLRLNRVSRKSELSIPSVDHILNQSVGSAIAIESACGLQALWDRAKELNQDDAINRTLDSKLKALGKINSQSLVLVDTIVVLRCRNGKLVGKEITPIEKISLLMKVESFATLSVQELSRLAESAEVQSVPSDSIVVSEGDPVTGIAVLAEGEILRSHNTTSELLKPFEVFGDDSGFGLLRSHYNLRSLGCRILRISFSSITDLARKNGEIAKHLVKRKLKSQKLLDGFFETTVNKGDSEARH